ncbi:MAG: beta-galactosidase trimerization domain-containing protein, partial [Victivallales bacterium]
RIGAETRLNNAVRRYYGLEHSLILMYPYTDEEYYINWAYAKSYNQKIWNCPGNNNGSKWDKKLPLWEKALKFENEHPELFEKSDLCTDIAILFPRRSRLIYGGCSDEFVTDEYCGFCETFIDNNIMFDVILEEELLNKLDNYKLAVLPNAACLTDAEINAVYNFVNNGGRLIATDQTGEYDDNGKKRENGQLLNMLGINSSEKIAIAPCKKGKVCHINYRPGIRCCTPFYYLHPKSQDVITYKDERDPEQMRVILDCLRRLMPEGLRVEIDSEKEVTVAVFEYKNKRNVVHIVNRKGALLENGAPLSRKFSENIHYPKLRKPVKIKTPYPPKSAYFYDPLMPDNCYAPEITQQKDGFLVNIEPEKIKRHGILELTLH